MFPRKISFSLSPLPTYCSWFLQSSPPWSSPCLPLQTYVPCSGTRSSQTTSSNVMTVSFACNDPRLGSKLLSSSQSCSNVISLGWGTREVTCCFYVSCSQLTRDCESLKDKNYLSFISVFSVSSWGTEHTPWDKRISAFLSILTSLAEPWVWRLRWNHYLPLWWCIIPSIRLRPQQQDWKDFMTISPERLRLFCVH